MSNQIPANMIQRDTFNPLGGASRPGNLTLSDFKLKMLRPDLYGIGATFKRVLSKLGVGCSARDMILSILAAGDSQPAIVVSLKPLLVSVYSDEFDAVVILDIPETQREPYALRLGTRLMACCFYGQDERVQKDIVVGPGYSKRWQIFMPVLADLCSGDYDRIRQRKQMFSEDDWHKAWYMGLAYRKMKPGWVRFGLPGLSMVEAFPPANAREAARSIYDRA